ncbi:MAG: HAMP domain-containing histidine kinase [Deltaproteobacteria bacterium]|nr:HAMP domain-containing histidine kinase [Deltaproteobacteria bacterium]
MSSSPNPKPFRKTVGFRLTAWYSAIFIFSAILLFGFSYFYISASLKKQEHRAISAELKQLASLYAMGGLDYVERKVTAHRKFERDKPFLVRIGGPNNETQLLILPAQWMEFDIKQLERISCENGVTWTSLHGKNGKTALELATIRLPDQSILQVGKSVLERWKILEHFRRYFLLILAPLVVLGLAGGSLVAFRALRPIRHIITAVRSATLGKMDTRVASTGTNDELGELITLFNEMLNRIEMLIEAMRDSLDNVAHDLRTPMTRLRGIAEMALRSNQSVEECREALAECIEESEHILKMLDALMDISEAQMGAMKLNCERIDIGDVVNHIGEVYGYIAEDRGISLNIRSPKGIWVYADSTRLYQVISNLLENALKYTPRGGSIDVDAAADHNEIVIAVKDTGIGIPEEELSRIWDRSYRGDQSRSQSGLGLGLSLVKALVEAHNGRVSVSSRPGKGSTFTICLPAAKP